MVKQQAAQRYTMRIIAVKVEPEHLKPGDLWSDRGPEYWGTVNNKLATDMIFVKLNIDFDEPETDEFFRITIVVIDNETKSESSNAHERHNEMSPYAPPGVSLDEWKRT